MFSHTVLPKLLDITAPLLDDSEQQEGSDPATSERPAYETGAYASGTQARRSRTPRVGMI